jgi:phage regulator Rha-like protein
VFLEPSSVKSIPYTTSDIIAEQVNVDYRSIQRTIETHHKRLEKFGQVRFQITPVKNKRGTNDKKIYYLNEEQATLVVTFLKNTDIVADFKTELVRQFYLMRTELQKRQITGNN